MDVDFQRIMDFQILNYRVSRINRDFARFIRVNPSISGSISVSRFAIHTIGAVRESGGLFGKSDRLFGGRRSGAADVPTEAACLLGWAQWGRRSPGPDLNAT